MTEGIFFQIPFISNFLLPFLLVFFLGFAILEKIKLFGDNKKQLNALISFIVGLIFAGVVYPKLVISNMISYLAITLVCIFIILLIWGFIFGDYAKDGKAPNRLKFILAIVASISFVAVFIWATGWSDTLLQFFTSNSSMNKTILTNGIFVLVIAAALALVLKNEVKK